MMIIKRQECEILVVVFILKKKREKGELHARRGFFVKSLKVKVSACACQAKVKTNVSQGQGASHFLRVKVQGQLVQVRVHTDRKSVV